MSKRRISPIYDKEAFKDIQAVIRYHHSKEEEKKLKIKLLFSKYDSDKDGFLTIDELKSMFVRESLADDYTKSELCNFLDCVECPGRTDQVFSIHDCYEIVHTDRKSVV